MRGLDGLPLAFDRADALGRGWTRHQFHLRSRRDDVLEVAPRVFADAVAWHLADEVTRHRALTRHAQTRWTGGVVTHVSAAVVHGLPVPSRLPAAVSITIDRARRTSDDPEWVDVRRSVLPDEHVTIVDGIVVTGLARTAVDCLRTLRRTDGLAVADAVVRRGVPPSELVAVRQMQHRWPGVRTARWGIGLVDGRRESWFESASVAVLSGWLPTPLPQVEVRDRASGAFIGRVDNLWQGLRVVGEADGVGKFLGLDGADPSPDAVARRLVAAAVRADRLREVGLGVASWGTHDLRSGQALAARVAAAAPTGPSRAELACGVCHEELPDCRCAPRLCLRRPADDG
ncbi:hypothetical protein [Phycicoccus sonneratiae]|uniref:Uncharacterized protein n=1 Tax=Phycicoccus sonneratiae TaxID=2807628 RepID=A0ABS2CLS9_9MICO|nr:hypothetical protein [Phycicoccus sonneraticus]MBM6400842.1 hypothetical protein [Phycicoccus sonneraticus]